MAKRSLGVPGSAVLFGTAGLYLVYVGYKDIGFVDGLRSLLRREAPQSKTPHSPYTPTTLATVQLAGQPSAFAGTRGPNDKGIDALVGNARTGYAAIRALGNWTIYGWGLRADMSSDHPKGLAIDVMNPTDADAQRIITVFRGTPGAKYWIWKRQIANVARDNWRIRPYSGPSPHTDHVHLSWS